MPLVDLETIAGPGRFHYTLSTPTDANAKAIVEGIPTLILIHPVYLGSHVFHPIYADPMLRRFNLVAIDLRLHGRTSAKVENTYGRETAARDVLMLMGVLKLPPCHIMGVAMGACIALQMAVLAPEKVLSTFMFSPPPLKEPPGSAGGRQEIFDYWVAGFRDPANVDRMALEDAIVGSLQLAYNNIVSNMATSMLSLAISDAMRNWNPADFDSLHTVTVKFFLDLDPHPLADLARIRGPIALIHCSEDIAYPLHYCEEFLDLLHRAGLDAKIYIIDGAPHLGNVTHWRETNALLHDFLVDNSAGMVIPSAEPRVESPFHAALLRAGLQEGDSDDDSD
ncbi:Alpha/Beta hydrolase protein [Mycena maculata]|uniref:Alpha/Beta hydrolase protein n=1 Tax=Mycena maculata TaxID=230809 RepID=A0AAD7NML5_9AGAR|nr:Alpha/Beta hydrolase protein [Mycena maculata]